MKKFLLSFFVVIFLLSPFSLAQDTLSSDINNVKFILYDINNTILNYLFVEVEVNKDNSNEQPLEYMLISDDNGTIYFNLKDGVYDFIFKGDDTFTSGKDYYLKQTFNISDSGIIELQLLPVGSIKGTVVDELDNVIGYADISFTCDRKYGDSFPDNVGKFGFLSIDYVPVGECKISALKDNKVGFMDITVKQGSLEKIDIRIDRSIISGEEQVSSEWNYVLYFIIAAAICIALIFFIVKTSKEAPKEKAVETPNKEDFEVPEKSKAIIETLRDVEKDIVQYLIDNKGESTQAKIKNALFIPHSSLFRQLQSLEQKKIIKIELFGKLKKVYLSGFFLGKEEE